MNDQKIIYPFNLYGAPKTYDQYVSEGGNAASSIAYQNWVNAYNAAETERQRATQTAKNQYDTSRQTYGAMAEKLRSSGLQDSGYSDYLDSRAYSGMISGMSSAYKTESDAKALAANTAAEAYGTIANEQNSLYTSLMVKALSDELTEKDYALLDAYVSTGQLSEPNSEGIKSVVSGRVTKRQEQKYTEYMNNISNLTAEQVANGIRAEIDSGDITAEQYEDIRNAWEKSHYVIDADDKTWKVSLKKPEFKTLEDIESYYSGLFKRKKS